MQATSYTSPPVDQRVVEIAKAGREALWRIIVPEGADHAVMAYCQARCPKAAFDQTVEMGKHSWPHGLIERIDTSTGAVSGSAFPLSQFH